MTAQNMIGTFIAFAVGFVVAFLLGLFFNLHGMELLIIGIIALLMASAMDA